MGRGNLLVQFLLNNKMIKNIEIGVPSFVVDPVCLLNFFLCVCLKNVKFPSICDCVYVFLKPEFATSRKELSLSFKVFSFLCFGHGDANLTGQLPLKEIIKSFLATFIYVFQTPFLYLFLFKL